jgi:diphthine synthase
MGIDTHMVHGASIQTAICGLTGLQNYRFGRSATVTYPHRDTVSRSAIDTVKANLSIDAHTLLYMDISDAGEPMTIPRAVEILLVASNDCDWREFGESWAVGMARAGSPSPIVVTRRIKTLGNVKWGEPLHVMVIPAPLHVVEFEALCVLTDAPEELKEYAR